MIFNKLYKTIFNNNNNIKIYNKKTNNNYYIKNIFILIIFLIFIFYIINLIIIHSNNDNSNNNNNNNNITIVDNNDENLFSNLFKKTEIKKENNEHQTLTNNNSSSTIAIIIPFYNHIKYLEFTLKSIIDQTYKDYNIIIIDDNSSDWNIKGKLRKLYIDNIENLNITIIFNKSNYGLSKCRNLGIEYTNSEWILPLDSDDIIDNKFIEKAFQQIHIFKDSIKDIQEDYDYSNIIVTSNVYRFNNDDDDDKNGYINKVDTWRIPKWDTNQLKQNNLLHCSTIFKKSLWKSIGGYDESLWFGWEDWDFWLRSNQYFNNNYNKLYNKFIKNQLNNNNNNNISNKLIITNGIQPIIIDEYLFYYRVKKEGLHSFCKANFKLCFSLFQTLHSDIYSVEDLLISHKYIGRNGEILKNSLNNQIRKYPSNPINYFWLSLIEQYNNNKNNSNSNNNNNNNNSINNNKKQLIKSLYQKSIELENKRIKQNNNNNNNNNNGNNLIWQFELHKILNDLESINYIQANKDILLLFKKYGNLKLNDKINRLYNLNL